MVGTIITVAGPNNSVTDHSARSSAKLCRKAFLFPISLFSHLCSFRCHFFLHPLVQSPCRLLSLPLTLFRFHLYARHASFKSLIHVLSCISLLSPQNPSSASPVECLNDLMVADIGGEVCKPDVAFKVG